MYKCKYNYVCAYVSVCVFDFSFQVYIWSKQSRPLRHAISLFNAESLWRRRRSNKQTHERTHVYVCTHMHVLVLEMSGGGGINNKLKKTCENSKSSLIINIRNDFQI